MLNDHLTYENEKLACDGVRLDEIAARHGTPCYVYSSMAIESAYRSIAASVAKEFPKSFVAYAVKANPLRAILRQLATYGSGFDVVSGGELARVMDAGAPAARVVMSGVGKSDTELLDAMTRGIRSIHVESEEELDVIATLATRYSLAASVSLRVNPNVDPMTHKYIATGLRSSKFGLADDAAERCIERALTTPAIRLVGLTCHIGSQISNATAIEEAARHTAGLVMRARELGAPVTLLDVGGGFPIAYGDERGPLPSVAVFMRHVGAGIDAAGLARDSIELAVEPGRAIVGAAGVLLTRVLYRKTNLEKSFVVVDAAMTELIRPALYGAHHQIVAVDRSRDARPTRVVDVVGPVCETADFLAQGRMLPELDRGDLLAVLTSGAYGSSMASQYNSRPRAPEIIVEHGIPTLARHRESYVDLVRGEV